MLPNRCFHFSSLLLAQLICLSVYGQESPVLIDEKLDSLQQLRKAKQAELNLIDSHINQLEQKKLSNQLSDKYRGGVAVYCKVPTKLYQKRGTWSEIIDTVPQGYTLLAYDYQSNYYLVEFDTLIGYVFTLDVETIEKRVDRLEREKRRTEQTQKQRQETIALQNERKRILINKYGSDKGLRIFNGKIWLGMSMEMVADSWGDPSRINKSVGSWGVSEQWIYYGSYLYIRNGTLTSWQETK
jgi:hypothetical protein